MPSGRWVYKWMLALRIAMRVVTAWPGASRQAGRRAGQAPDLLGQHVRGREATCSQTCLLWAWTADRSVSPGSGTPRARGLWRPDCPLHRPLGLESAASPSQMKNFRSLTVLMSLGLVALPINHNCMEVLVLMDGSHVLAVPDP